MPNIFEIKTNSPAIFYGNKKTGRWALGNRLNPEVLTSINKPFEKKRFNSTSMVVLNITRECNFDCTYCHVGSLKNKEKMSEEVGIKTIDRVFKLPEEQRTVVFHGSEPMTNFPLIKTLVEYSRGKGKIEFAMQSNGSLLTNDAIEYLTSNGVGIGISLDGLCSHQNTTRPFVGGNESYGTVLNNSLQVSKKQNKLALISVVSKHNVKDLEAITKDFESKGFHSVSFSLLYPTPGNEQDSPTSEELINSMLPIADTFVNKTINEEPTIKIANYQDHIRSFFKPLSSTNCAPCGGTECHPLIGVDIDGSIYPCDYFWGRKEYSIGNINNTPLHQSFNHPKNFRVYRNIENIEECNECKFEKYCGGGCPGSSMRLGKGIEAKSHYCEYIKTMLTHAIQNIPRLHKAQKLGTILLD